MSELYDTVFFNDKCWNCKHPLHTWETTSGSCLAQESLDAIDFMRQYDLSQIEIHRECENCNKWNSKVINRQKAIDNKRKNTYWNYRLIRRIFDTGEEEIAIYEVYYENGEPRACSVNPVFPHGETLDEFNQDLERYKDALDKPVLEYASFDGNDGLDF